VLARVPGVSARALRSPLSAPLAGFTTDPLILERDGVRCNVHALTQMARAGFALGASEVHLQSWGDSPRKLVSHALDLAGIDPQRVVVKLPCTDNGIAVRVWGGMVGGKGQA